MSLIYALWESQKEERKGKEIESLFNAINENSKETVNLEREVKIQIHEAQRTQNTVQFKGHQHCIGWDDRIIPGALKT